MGGCILLLIVCLVTQAFAGFDSINKDVVIKKVERSVNLESQLVRISTKMTVENTGRGAVKSILFAVEEEFKSNLAFIQALVFVNKEEMEKIEDEEEVSEEVFDDDKQVLTLQEARVQEKKNVPLWKIELSDAISPGGSSLIIVEMVLSHVIEPYPHEISQSERQLVVYRGNHYLYSPYLVRTQTTNVQLISNNVERYSKLKPAIHRDTTITYGAYDNIQPFSLDEMSIHYENNQPFMAVTTMTRHIEVSHWGNIAVEETIDIRHTGAKLKGSFSRYDYQREQNSGQSSVKSFKTILPASAGDVYYRDEIGNISTSHMRTMPDSVELDLRPRFPLFGGWKTRYTLGYNLPSYEYLFSSGEDFLLKMRFLDHVFDDMVVDELIVKVILPEGSKDWKLHTEYLVSRQADSRHYTYLDTTGRPVITAAKQNLVENHIQDLELSYKFPRILMLQEPFLIILAFHLLFLVVIIYVRMDFSITKDEGRESRMRVSGYCEKIQSHHDRRTFIYKQYDETINKFKSSKDNTSFSNSVKNLNLEHKTETTAVQELMAKMKGDAPDVAERVAEIQKLDKSVKDMLGQQVTYAEKLVTGKMNKQQYIENENNISKKKEDVLSKMSTMVMEL